MDGKLRVGVLFGGRSGEHEVSLVSARAIMQALAASGKYTVVPIGITRTGRWLLRPDALPLLAAQAQSPLLQAVSAATVDPAAEEGQAALLPDGRGAPLARLSANGPAPERIDVVFPVLHGPYGEDGTVQGFLELAGIPYVGCGVAASAVGMDKHLMKQLFRAAGLPVAPWVLVRRSLWERAPDRALDQAGCFGFPCFVKPANLGSSVGVTKAHDREELAAGLAAAARYDTKLLVEQAIDAREIECSVLGNEAPMVSLPGEIIPGREFYDYRAKYLDDTSQLLIPAPLSPEQTAQVQELARRAFQALDCAGMARVDFFLERATGRLLVNEVNTIPGFTPISMYPKLWEASGISYPELVDRLIQLALERHAARSRLETVYRPPATDRE